MSMHTIKFLVCLNNMQRSRILQLTKALYGATICAGPQRSICLSHHHNTIASGRLLNVEEGIIKRTWKKFFYKLVHKNKLKRAGYYLYEAVADKVDYLQFFKVMSLPDTFNSWFLVTELHVWMLMTKSMEYGADGRYLRNNIVEAMWSDVSLKTKKLGPEHLSMAREQVQLMGEQFQAAILGYDEGILTDDRVLASALWRRFFEGSCQSATSLETMVKYVRYQMLYLDKMTEKDFKECNIVWTSLDKL